jgi:hypothetical protein
VRTTFAAWKIPHIMKQATRSLQSRFGGPSDTSRSNRATIASVMFRKWNASFRPDVSVDLRTRVLCKNSAIISLAGPIAGAHFCGRKKWRGADGDIDNVVSMIDHISAGHEETEAYIQWLVVRSKLFVCSDWPRIEAVARELLTKPKRERRLSSRQVREIVAAGPFRGRYRPQ